MRSKIGLIALVWLTMLVRASGQGTHPVADPVAEALESARKTYLAELAKGRDPILQAFVVEDEKAREAADVALVKTLKDERAWFEATGKVPGRFDFPEYTRQRERLRRDLLDAYTTAIRAYLKARKDDQAEEIKEERDQFDRTGRTPSFRRPKTNPTPAPVDPFGLTRFDSVPEEVRGVKLHVGDPQFTLLWDSDADLDLHVIEPGGQEIFWNDRKGKRGGELDVDNVEGFGPENIYWLKLNPDGSTGVGPGPSGDYRWFVHYYGGNRGIPVTSKWQVRIKHAGKSEIIQGTLTVPGAKSSVQVLQVK